MKMPTLFVGHGSPMIALENNEITKKFYEVGKEIIENYGKPKAILMISAHWYTDDYFIQNEENPKQIYDMYGFPEELYKVRYEVKGDLDLSQEVIELTQGACKINNEWGIDHGTWTVLTHMFPKADIPVVQLSVNGAKGIEDIFRIGKKLAPLREKGYLIMGSGNIVHNLRAVKWDMKDGTKEADDFDEFIKESILKGDYNEVLNFKKHENSKYAVPTLDHFLPLIYVLGASEGLKPSYFNNVRNLGAISMTSYLFEE